MLLYVVSITVCTHAYADVCRGTTSSIPDIRLIKIAKGFNKPVHITHAGDGSGRLFVVEQSGLIRIIQHGKVLDQPFLDIQDRVRSGGEKGLLSVAFAPNYSKNGYLYVNYTGTMRRLSTIIARFKRQSDNTADPNSEKILLSIEQPYGNHNGGQIVFGPDGYLYIGMGDGGSRNDPHNNGQNTMTLLGAILRIDVNTDKVGGPYNIPGDNPFLNKRGYLPELWAYGLRNPWRFSFDASSGLLYAADVGQNAVEEIDIVVKGNNYGWRIMEGDICTPKVKDQCPKPGLTPPIFTYRQKGNGYSVTGGYVYRGKVSTALCGVYLYADYVSKRIWGLRYNNGKVTAQRKLLETSYNISSFGQGEDLEVYVAGYTTGKILHIKQRK